MSRAKRLDEQRHVLRIGALIAIGAALITTGRLIRAVDDNLADLGD